MAQWWPWAMCVAITSRYTASIILVVITNVKEQRVVAISLLHSNVTFVDNLIRHWHWIETATTMIVVAFTFALMARERRRSCGSQAVTCRNFCLRWSKIVIDRSQCIFIVRVTDSTFNLWMRPYPINCQYGMQVILVPYRVCPFSHRVPY